MPQPRVGFHVSAFGSENVLAALSACSKYGFEAIEIFADTSLIFADRPGEFRSILGISGVKLGGVHCGGMLTAPEYHAAEIAEWERVFDWTRDVGGSYAVYYGGECTDDPFADLEHAAQLLDALGRAAEKRGVTFCYEADRRCPFRTSYALSALLARTHPSHVQLSVDMAQVAQLKPSPSRFLATHGRRIAVVHVRDLGADSSPDLSGDGYVDPGSGTIDLAGLRDTLVTTGFEGWIVGVVSRPHAGPTRSAQNTAQFFRDVLRLQLTV